MQCAGVCVDLIEHLVDQGLAEGDNNNFLSFCRDDSRFGIDSEKVLAIGEELAAAGLLDDVVRAMNYYNGTDQTFSQTPSGDTDVILNYYGLQYRLLLCISDPSQRLQRLKAFRRALNLICTRLDQQPFGADGTAYHHGMHHWCYAGYEIPSVLRFLQTFNDTCFRLDPAAYETLKRFAFTMAWSANKYTMPSPLLARPGSVAKVDMADFAGRLADCGSADSTQPVDRDLASLFLALTDKPDGEQARKYRSLGITPYSFSGHRVLNGAATSIHRRGGLDGGNGRPCKIQPRPGDLRRIREQLLIVRAQRLDFRRILRKPAFL